MKPSRVAHQARAYPGFRSMKRLGVFLLPLDGMLVHRRVTCDSIKFAGTHLYTWVEGGTARVKCLVQEHSTMCPARARTRTARSGDERTNHETTAPPFWLGISFTLQAIKSLYAHPTYLCFGPFCTFFGDF